MRLCARITRHLLDGMAFFAGQGETLTAAQIAAKCFAPTPLARGAFMLRAMKNAARIGAKTLILLGAGYETLMYRQEDWMDGLRVFALDLPDTQRDLIRRAQRVGWTLPEGRAFIEADLTQPGWDAGLPKGENSLVCLPGVTYYLTCEQFCGVLDGLHALLGAGGALVMDYPTPQTGDAAKRVQALAAGAGEAMRAEYGAEEMEALLEAHGFLTYEHLGAGELEAQFFRAYQSAHPDCPCRPVENVRCLLAVKR